MVRAVRALRAFTCVSSGACGLKSLKLQLAEESDVLLRSYDRPGARRVGGRRPGEREPRGTRGRPGTRAAPAESQSGRRYVGTTSLCTCVRPEK